MVIYNAKFHSLNYEEGVRFLKQGVKGHYTPRYAVAGGNGSFICAMPSELILTLKTPAGKPFYSNIIRIVKDVNGWKKITQKRVAKLKKKLSRETFVIEDNEIKDLEYLVRV